MKKAILIIFLFLVLCVGIFFFIYCIILKKKLTKEELKYNIKEFTKSRALMGSLCLIVGIILSFCLTPMVNDAINQKVKVFETVRDIKIGEKLNINMFKEVEVGSYGLSNQIIDKKENIENKYATVFIPKGQYLYKENISNEIPYDNAYLYKSITGLNRAISFTVKNLANAVSNKLIQGDIISLIFVDTNNQKVNQEIAYIPEELKYVEVLTTTNDIGVDIEDTDEKSDDTIYKTITVLVSDEQAKLIAMAESTKQIYAELVYRQGDSKIANYLLNKQTKLLNDKYPPTDEDKQTEEDIKNMLFNENYDVYTGDIDIDYSNSLREINEGLKEQIRKRNNMIEDLESENDEDINLKETEETTEDEKENETIDETKETTISSENQTETTTNIEKEEYERIKKQYNAN